MGIGIVGDTQEDITPLQRQIIDAEQDRQAREKQKRQEEARSGNSGGRQRNQMAGGSPTSSRSETVRYESNSERDDGNDTLEVIK